MVTKAVDDGLTYLYLHNTVKKDICDGKISVMVREGRDRTLLFPALIV